MNGNGNANGSMSGNSYFSLECLIGIIIIGTLLIFFDPKYAVGVYAVLTALVQALGNSQGVKSGSKMPEQAGGPQPGQSSQTETTTKVSTQAPSEPPK
jgi:hypothetical protein